MGKQDSSEICRMISVLLLTISKGQQIQQCIREVMTTHPLFNPLSLFKYISKNTPAIKKEHLLCFLLENQEKISEDQVKTILFGQSGKRSWQYSDFLEVIYPFNSAVLREITNLHLKKYQQLQKYGVNESAITSFLMFLTSKVQLRRKLQIQKENFVSISKQKLKKVLLSIKQRNGKQPNHCENDKTRITSLQLRNFLKAQSSIQENHFLYLCRRLKLKNGSFPLENLERLLKPKKNKSKQIKQIQYSDPDQSEDKNFNERSYKQQLYQQLNQSVHLAQSKKQNKIGQKSNHSTSKKTKYEDQNQAQILFLAKKSKPKYISYQQNEQDKCENTHKQLFIKFIEVFLPLAKQLQKLKIKVAQQKIDLLALFKKIDRSSRGVATAEDLYHYYVNAGGIISFSPKEFSLIIQKYGQSEDPWISFSQFYSMVKAEEKQVYNKTVKDHEKQSLLILKILQLCIKSQINIKKICKQFKKNQIKYLFNLINQEKTGFINYQQLKKFLIGEGLLLSMNDLMIILKRLDKSRNGVIVEQEFISHFQPTKLNY